MLITDFDSVVAKRISILEAEYNCVIFIENKEENFIMTVAYPAQNRVDGEVKLCSTHQSKYALASAIRDYFKR